MLEGRRPAIDIKLKDQLTSSINLGYYPPSEALRKALLANKEVFLGLVDEIVDSIHQVFSTRMTAAADKNAALALPLLFHGRKNFVTFPTTKNGEN